MGTALTPNTNASTRIGFPENVLVTYGDMASEQQADYAQSALPTLGQIGILNALPGANAIAPPLIVTQSGSGGVDLQLGGGRQTVFCGGLWCDGCASQSYVVPASPTPTSGQTRIDLICIQPALVATGATNTRQALVSGVVQNVSEPINNVGLNYQYVVGTPASSPVAPTVPAGYYAFAQITYNSLATATVELLFPPIGSGHGSVNLLASAALVDGFGYPNATFVIPDPHSFPIGTNGWAWDSSQSIGVQFEVTAVTGPAANGEWTLTVAILEYVDCTSSATLAADSTIITPNAQIPPLTFLYNAMTVPTVSGGSTPIGGVVDIIVVSAARFPKGTFGTVVDPATGNTMAFRVTGVIAGSHELVAICTSCGGNATAGTVFPVGSFVVPGGISNCITTNQISIPALSAGVTLDLTDAGLFDVDDLGFIVGPNNANSFYFIVTSISGNAVAVTNEGAVEVDGSGILLAGAQVFKVGMVVTSEFNTTSGSSMTLAIQTGSKSKGGTVTFSGAGTCAVTFDQPYTGNTDYAIVFGANGSGPAPTWSSKTRTGFTITAGGAGIVDFVCFGY